MECSLRNAAVLLLVVLFVGACAHTRNEATTAITSARVSGANIPEEVRQELSSDLAALQDQIRVPRIITPVPGPLNKYQQFATSSRGGAVMSSPTDRAQVVTTVYPGAVMGLSGKEVGDYVEVGYEYYGRLLTGWVDPDKAGLTAGASPTAYSPAEKKALYAKILSSVNALRAKWHDNQYVSIGGFEISVGRTPSVNVTILYK